MNAFPVDCGRCRHHTKVEDSTWKHCACPKSEYFRRPTLGGYSCAEGELRTDLAEYAKPLAVGARVQWIQKLGSKISVKTGEIVKMDTTTASVRVDGKLNYVEKQLTALSRIIVKAKEVAAS